MTSRTIRAGAMVAAGLLALAAHAAPARAQSAAPPPAAAAATTASGADLYQQRTCVACHGKDAKTPILPNYPRLAGQSREYLAQQIRDIKSGARNNGQTAAMKGVMHLVSEAEIDVLAEYLANLK